MQTNNEEKCPSCGNEDVTNTGDKFNGGGDMGSNGSYQEPTHPVFKCNKCEERFFLK